MKIVHEQVVHQKGQSVSFFDSHHLPFNRPFHQHREWELLLILNGQGRLLCGDRIDRFSPGDIFLFSPWLPHSLQPHSEEQEPFSMFFQWSIESPVFRLPEIQKAQSFWKKASRGLRFSRSTSKNAEGLFLSASQANDRKKLNAFISIISNLIEDKESQMLAGPTFFTKQTFNKEDNTSLEDVILFIQTNYQKPILLKTIANYLEMHPQSFSRFFRKKMGITFQTYINHWRLSEAASQLTSTTRDISGIASSCGYTNLSNFNRQFKNYFFQAPRDYRNRLNN